MITKYSNEPTNLGKKKMTQLSVKVKLQMKINLFKV